MGGSAKKTAKSKTTKWSEAFTRTADLPCVFTVHWSFYDKVRDLVSELSLPTHHQGGVFSTWYWATAVLDGYVLENSTEGFRSGRLPSGLRIVGTNPLRLICHLLELGQPRIRPDETQIPAREELLLGLERQQRNQSEPLKAELEELLFADTTADLTVLAYELFGEPALPKEINYDAARRIPGPGEWGRAGISIRDYREFNEAGVGIEEAVQWLRIAKSWNLRTILASDISLDDAISWHEEGIDVDAMPRLKEVGATTDEVKEWIALGGFAGNYPRARERGITAEQVRPFMELEYSDLAAATLVEHKVPVEVVRALDQVMNPKPWDRQVLVDFAIMDMNTETLEKWIATGIAPSLMHEAVAKSIAVEDVQALVDAGKSRQQIESFIKKR